MIQDVLESLGLNRNDAILYRALITAGPSSLSRIAERAGIHRRNALDSLKALIRKGLVFEAHEERLIVYHPVEPQKLVEMVREKEQAVLAVLPSLQRAYERKVPDERVCIYRGIEGFKNNLRDILRIGEPVYEIGAKGGWFSPQLGGFSEEFLRELKRKKILHYHLFDHEARALLRNELKRSGDKVRFLPEGYSTGSAIRVFGDYVVTFTGLSIRSVREDVTLFAIVSRELAESYRTWFKLLWDVCA